MSPRRLHTGSLLHRMNFPDELIDRSLHRGRAPVNQYQLGSAATSAP